MKINNQTFNLNEELTVSIDDEDNDGLINIPKNINLVALFIQLYALLIL